MSLRFQTASAFFFSLMLGMTALAGVAAAVPAKGTFELRIPGGHLDAVGIPAGITFTSIDGADNTSSKLSLAYVAAGLGYFVSDNVEVGATLGLLRMKVGDNDTSFGPAIAPFVRGLSMVAPRLALFGEGMVEYVRMDVGDASTSSMSFGFDAGVEFFLAESWALRVAPGYRYRTAKISIDDFSDEQTAHAFGLGWGIAAYF